MLLWVSLKLCMVFGTQEYGVLTDYLPVIASENTEMSTYSREHGELTWLGVNGPCIKQGTWSLWNFLTMEHVFSATTTWAWDRRGCQLMLAKLWLSMLGMTPLADKTRAMTVLFICHCCLISNANSWYLRCLFDIVACRLWVNGISVPINATYLFVLSTSVMSGPL